MHEERKPGKVISYLLQLKVVAHILAISKRIVIPGFDKLPLYSVASFFISGLRKSSITTRASSMAFHFFLALFPAIIFFFTLIPYIPIADFQDQLMELLGSILPENVFDASRQTIEGIVNDKRGGLLSVGFLSMLYFATNGINSMIHNFNQTYHAVETRNFIQQRLVSIVLMLIMSTLILAAILIIILGKQVLQLMVDESWMKEQWTILLFEGGKWLIMIALYFFTISFIYFLGPAKRSRWRFISAGSTAATFFSILTSLGFAFFVNNFGQYNKLYGSLGTIIVMMLWIYFNSLILLIGFELNASIKSAGTKPTLQ
ncbi:MAG: YihY/virulence factor BrkB family protein [Flavobacteriales bacterium]|nr:YihY/virulence factor BrkB family protein [Flavobacteriales bacterium]